MRLLDRYLLRELLVPLAYCLSGFFTFWLAFDLFSELDDFQSLEMSARQIAHYYWLKSPELLVVVVPIALLLAALYALTQHARHQELVAMRAAGVSIWRLSLPYLAVGLVLSVGLLSVNELWVPRCSERAEALLRERENDPGANDPAPREWRPNLHFRNGRDGRIWWAQGFHVPTGRLIKPRIDWTAADGSARKLIAEQAAHTNGVWSFWDAQTFAQPSGGNDIRLDRTNRLDMPEFGETPEDMRSEIKIAGALARFKTAKRLQLSTAEIVRYLGWHRNELRVEERSALETLLHTRLAAPWTCAVVMLIALPFGAPSGRRNLFVGVASSILICFAFFVLRELSSALGFGGYAPPWAAGWLPNAFFALAGVVLTQRLR